MIICSLYMVIQVILKVVAVGMKGMEFVQKAVNALKAFKEKFVAVIDKVQRLWFPSEGYNCCTRL